MHTHTCIKPACGAKYQSQDPEAYYCPPCDVERKRIAQEVDAKIGARPKSEPVSSAALYESLPKRRGFVAASQIL